MKPPLELSAEITTAEGTVFRWDANGLPQDRPQNVSFSTKRGDGFAECSVTLSRRIDLDFSDLHLFDDFALIGADGSVAYEGRLASMPRSMDDGHSIQCNFVGWMSHAKDKKFAYPYVVRDLGSWGDTSQLRKASNMGASRKLGGRSSGFDATTSLASLAQTLDGPWNTAAIEEALFDSGDGNTIGAVYYDFLPTSNISIADANWNWEVVVHQNDDRSGSSVASGDLAAASGSGYYTPSTAYQYATLQFFYGGAKNAAADQQTFGLNWRKLAVYGNHGLTRQGTAPGGLLVSDVMRHIAQNWCPKLNTSGIQATTSSVPHIDFRQGIHPYDAFLELNKHHLWNLAVWEGKTLTFEPYDLSDYDWEVRLDDPGVRVSLQGDSTEDLANGIRVTYTDILTGRRSVITPDDDSNLADTSIENPANQHGLDVWTDLDVSWPTDASTAAQIGRAWLAEFNQPKGPGQITVQGHIRDRAGHLHAAYKPRSGDTVAITNHPNDRPRLIGETRWDDATKTMTLAVDSTLPRIEAVMDRVVLELAAAGL